MFCKNCGKMIAENSLFCTHCGTATDNTVLKNDTAAETETPFISEPIADAYAQPFSQPVTEPEQTPPYSEPVQPASAPISQPMPAQDTATASNIAPVAEKEQKYYTLGHLVLCLAAVGVMAIIAGIFAGLYFSVI